MYRSLNIEALGITGRQSELIELALTYRFKGMDLDMETFSRNVEKRGLEHATRCLNSAQKSAQLQVGIWELPVKWQGDDATFKAGVQKLPAMANTAKAIGATRCVTTVMAGHETLNLKENFDYHTARFKDIADLLAPHGISLGLGFRAPAAARVGLEFQFVNTAETLMTLIDMVGADNVGLHLDTWNWHLGGGTIADLQKLGTDKIVAVRTADVPADKDADSIELKQRLLPSPEGIVPNADILNALHEMGYEGPVSPYPHVSQYKGITRDKMVVRAADALRSVWPGAELAQEAEAEAEAEGSTPGASTKPEDAKPADAKPAEGEAKTAEAASATSPTTT